MTKKAKETTAAVILLGGGALLLWLLTRPAKAAPLPPPPQPQPEPRPEPPPEPEPDLDLLPTYQAESSLPPDLSSARQIQRQAALLGFGEGVMARQSDFAKRWNIGTLAAVAEAIAYDINIAPEIIWGVMARESSWVPVGRYRNSADPIVTASEYGVGQMTRPRWNAEAAANYSPSRVRQIDAIHPEIAMASIAQSYERGEEKHGGDVSYDAFGFNAAVQALADGEDDSPAVNAFPTAPEWIGAWWARPVDIGRPLEDQSGMSQNVYQRITNDGRQIRVLIGAQQRARRGLTNLQAEFVPDPIVLALIAELRSPEVESRHGRGFVRRMLALANAHKPTPKTYGSPWAPAEVVPEAASDFLAGSAFFPEYELASEDA